MDIRKSATLYERLKEDARRSLNKGETEKSLLFLLAASRFAYLNHFGRWADDESENLLSDIAQVLLPEAPPMNENKPGAIAYVASSLTPTGGHKRTLGDWIKCLSSTGASQHLFLTGVDDSRTETGFLKDINKDLIISVLPPDESYSERVRLLARQMAAIGPGHIVLFIHPYDVIAVAAISRLRDTLKAKTVFFNHSDGSFWLGKSITDTLVEHMPMSMEMARKTRGFKGQPALIPCTTVMGVTGVADPSLPIDSGGTISLSVGSAWRMVGDGRWNYLNTIKKILVTNSNHTHILLTTSRLASGGLFKSYLEGFTSDMDEAARKRFIVLYDVSDPAPYYRKADFLIETFPVAGGLVRFEAMAFKVPIVFIKNEQCPLTSENGVIPQGYPFTAISNAEVEDYANRLINDKKLREDCGNMLFSHFDAYYSFGPFCERLKALFAGNVPEPPPMQKPPPFDPEGEALEYLFRLDSLQGNYLNPYLQLLSVPGSGRAFSSAEKARILMNISPSEYWRHRKIILSGLRNRMGK